MADAQQQPLGARIKAQVITEDLLDRLVHDLRIVEPQDARQSVLSRPSELQSVRAARRPHTHRRGLQQARIAPRAHVCRRPRPREHEMRPQRHVNRSLPVPGTSRCERARLRREDRSAPRPLARLHRRRPETRSRSPDARSSGCAPTCRPGSLLGTGGHLRTRALRAPATVDVELLVGTPCAPSSARIGRSDGFGQQRVQPRITPRVEPAEILVGRARVHQLPGELEHRVRQDREPEPPRAAVMPAMARA
jgi:hypothetical protein